MRQPRLRGSRTSRIGTLAICLQAGFLAVTLLAQGCGTDSTAAMVTSGMPKCDASLLHPSIALGNTAALPGQTIVYVDGVMACVDDSAKVDQMLGQVDGRTHEPTPAAK